VRAEDLEQGNELAARADGTVPDLAQIPGGKAEQALDRGGAMATLGQRPQSDRRGGDWNNANGNNPKARAWQASRCFAGLLPLRNDAPNAH